jgi:2-phosphoglycerate kinase
MSGKPLVSDPDTGQIMPFLGGVLVQSLVTIGLSFPDAYEVAQRVRSKLEETDGPIDAARLGEIVGEDLEKRFGAQARLAYALGKTQRHPIRVCAGQREEAFSVGVLTRRLEGCGIRYEDAVRGAQMVERSLRQRTESVIDRAVLRRIVFETLQAGCCPGAADRYLSRCRFRDSGIPLILLIGGATGVGKSTAATRLASLLDIVRLQSTDMMREIIRCYMTPHVAPTLDYSSFDAWRGLPEVDPGLSQPPASDLILSGFLAQFGTVKVAIEATVARAIKEGEHLIIEGVHVLPSRLDLAAIADKALVIPLMLAVTTRDRLEEHLTRRSHEQPDRDGERHRLMLEEIWTLQSFMVDQAERSGIPVIAARGADETVASIMEEVMDRVIERFPPIPEDTRRRSRRRAPRQIAARTQARHGDSR